MSGSELEIDERLDVRRLDLHHAPDHPSGEQDLHDRRRGGDDALGRAVGRGGKHVQRVARTHQQEDAQVAL